MPATAITTKLQIIPGQAPVDVKIGSLGRGKGANKVRLVPVTKDANVNIALIKTLPGYENILAKFVGGIFSRHSPIAINGVPEELTEESLKAAVDNNTLEFDRVTFNESVASDYNAERQGRQSAETKYEEWNSENQARLNELTVSFMQAHNSGQPVPVETSTELTRLLTEQADLIAAVSEEEAKKEEARAKREAKKNAPAAAVTA